MPKTMKKKPVVEEVEETSEEESEDLRFKDDLGELDEEDDDWEEEDSAEAGDLGGW